MSNAVQIGANDVLTRIDAPVDWRWCSPTRKAVRQERREAYAGLRKMASNGFAHPGEESFIDKVHTRCL
ncbi:MAG: hypothetical protein GDA36_03125 [Rhodobacteraceae bacterium]|nr:hypothetical protein [Paracoccaceae bacterium]